ncbi:hypothetical protein IWZ03DRAFT_229837 [Phyllosticta citriasiana]|uniref:Uncharacterized protein n=1 Tax=Phyllosticta citriasiana TaxID=595635 RepID=A0ABR1KIY0_9PEZI
MSYFPGTYPFLTPTHQILLLVLLRAPLLHPPLALQSRLAKSILLHEALFKKPPKKKKKKIQIELNIFCLVGPGRARAWSAECRVPGDASPLAYVEQTSNELALYVSKSVFPRPSQKTTFPLLFTYLTLPFFSLHSLLPTADSSIQGLYSSKSIEFTYIRIDNSVAISQRMKCNRKSSRSLICFFFVFFFFFSVYPATPNIDSLTSNSIFTITPKHFSTRNVRQLWKNENQPQERARQGNFQAHKENFHGKKRQSSERGRNPDFSRPFALHCSSASSLTTKKTTTMTTHSKQVRTRT